MDTTTISRFTHIKGWGIDANPDNEPTYPIKNYTGDDHKRLGYKKPEMQRGDIEILKSVERPGLSSVYGTSVPPSGLSGKLRRYAYSYSEGSFAHWLPLLLADRINVWEGIAGDIRNGQIPNILGELGIRSEWKYNKKGLAKKVLAGAVITVGAILLLSGRKKKS